MYQLLSRDKYTEAQKRFLELQGGDYGNIRITADEFAGICRRCVDAICRLVNTTLDQLQPINCTYVFLVGGFADSVLLRRSIETSLRERTSIASGEPKQAIPQLIVPARPGQAVLWGAARVGLDPARIGLRRVRFMYGCEVVAPFDESADELGRVVIDELTGEKMCRGRFEILVRAGEPVNPGEYVRRRLTPTAQNQRRATFRIFRVIDPERAPRYVDDPAVEFVGDAVLPLKKIEVASERILELQVGFGGTELHVWAKDAPTGEEVHVDLQF